MTRRAQPLRLPREEAIYQQRVGNLKGQDISLKEEARRERRGKGWLGLGGGALEVARSWPLSQMD
jgi:hypothetical protein